MTLTSEVLASDDAKMSSYVGDLRRLPQLNPVGNIRSSAPMYNSSPSEEKVQVLVESPSRFTVTDAMARGGYPTVLSAPTTSCTLGDAVNYGMPLSSGTWPYDAARNCDGMYSWPASPSGIEIGSPLCYNQLVPVAAPICYSSMLPMSPPSLVLEQHVEHLHCELQQAREDAKDDVLRCAREAARGLVAEAPLRKENELLRSEKTNLETSLEQAMANFAREREQLIQEKQFQLDEFAAERNKRRASLDRASCEIETSIANAKAQAHAEVEVLHAQLAALVTNQQRLVDDNLSLQETGRKREEAISSLQGMLEEERNRMRLLQSEFETLKVDGSRKFDISEVEDLRSRLAASRSEEHRLGLDVGNLTTACAAKEASVVDLRQKLDQERDSNRQLQRDLEQVRIESDAKAVKIKEQAGNDVEELRQRFMQLTNDHDRLKKELLEGKNRDAEHELTIAKLKQSVDFKDQCLQQLQGDLEAAKGGVTEREMTIADRKKSAVSKDQRLQQLQAELLEGKHRDAERELTIASLKQSIDFKNERLQELQGDLEAAKGRVTEREMTMANRKKSADSKDQRLQQLQFELEAAKCQDQGLERTIANLKESIDFKDQRLQDLQGDLEAAKGRETEREMTLANQRKSADSKDQRLQQLQGELEAARCRDTGLELTIANLKQSADFKDQRLQQLQGDLEAARGRDTENEVTIAKLKQSVDFKDQRLQQVQGELEVAKGRDAEHELVIAKLKQSVDFKDQRLQDLQGDLDAAKGRDTEREMTIANRKKSADIKDQRLQQLQGDLESAKGRDTESELTIAKLKQSADFKDQRLQQLQDDLEAAKGREAERDTTILKLKQSVDSKDQRVQQLQGELEVAKGRDNEREMTIANLKNSVDFKDQRLQQLQGDLEAAKGRETERDMSISNLKQNVAFKDQRLQQLQDELETGKGRDTERELTIANLKSSVDFKDQRLQQLQEDLEAVRIERDAHIRTGAMLQGAESEQVEKMRRLLDDMAAQRDQLNQDHYEVKSRVAERDMTIASLKQSIDFKEDCFQKVQRDLENLRTERDDLRRKGSLLQGAESEQVEKLRKQVDDMVLQRDQLNQDVLSMKSTQMQLERANEGLRASLDEERLKSNGMTQLKDDNERLKLELFDAKGKDVEREMAITNLKKTVDFKDQHIERLQGSESEQVEKLRKQVDDMASQRDQLNQDVLSMKSAQMQLERANEGLRASLDEERLKSSGMAQLKDDNERLKLELFDAKGKDVEREMAITNLKKSIDFKDQHIERLNGDLESSRNERDVGIQKESLRYGAQSEQVQNLQKQLDAMSAQREELSQKVIGAETSQLQSERTIHSLRSDVEAEKNKVIALELDLQVARSESNDSAKGAQGELDSMRRKLQDARDEMDDLKMALRRSDDELAQYRVEKQASLDMKQTQGNSDVKMERDVEDLIHHVGVSQQSNGTGKVTSLSNLREVFDVQHRNIQQLQKELQAVKSERDAVVRGTTMKRGSVEELVDVRRQLQSAEMENENLRARLQAKADKQDRSSVTDVVGLRKQVSTLENENNQLRSERQSLADRADQAKRQSLGEVLELRQKLSVAEAEVQQRKAAEDFARSTSRPRDQTRTSMRKVDFDISVEARTLERGSRTGSNSGIDVDLTQDDGLEEYDADLTHDGDVKLSTRTSSWLEKSTAEDAVVATPPGRRSDVRESYSGSPVERKKLSMSSRGSGK